MIRLTDRSDMIKLFTVDVKQPIHKIADVTLSYYKHCSTSKQCAIITINIFLSNYYYVSTYRQCFRNVLAWIFEDIAQTIHLFICNPSAKIIDFLQKIIMWKTFNTLAQNFPLQCDPI